MLNGLCWANHAPTEPHHCWTVARATKPTSTMAVPKVEISTPAVPQRLKIVANQKPTMNISIITTKKNAAVEYQGPSVIHGMLKKYPETPIHWLPSR